MARHIILDTIELAEQAAPSTPAAGRGGVYLGIDKKLYLKDSTGTVTDLGSGASISQVEVNLGATAVRQGKFTISDASIAAGSQINVVQSGDVPTGKGTRADENEMDFIKCRATVTGAGAATVYWSSDTLVQGNFKFNWISG